MRAIAAVAYSECWRVYTSSSGTVCVRTKQDVAWKLQLERTRQTSTLFDMMQERVELCALRARLRGASSVEAQDCNAAVRATLVDCCVAGAQEGGDNRGG